MTLDDDDCIVLDEEPPKAIEAVTVVPREVNMDHVNLGIKELKNQLTEAGVSFAGATEKEDLVRLLTKAKAQAAVQKDMMVATYAWQRVPEGASLQHGLEVKFDMQHGCNYARLPPPARGLPMEHIP